MIFITGSTGFIGKYLLKQLSKTEKNVTCLVHKKKTGLIEGCDYIQVVGDLLDSSSFSKHIKKDDTIIHLASIIDSKNKSLIYEVNVNGTKNLVKASKKAGIKKIIYVSSINAKLNKGDYAKSKKQAEEIIKSSGLNYVIIRPTLVYDDYGKNDLIKLIKIVNSLY